MIDLLNNNIIPHAVLKWIATNADAHNVIESRQHHERGLLHITDKAFQFFQSLEQERVNMLSLERMSFLKYQMVDQSVNYVLENEALQQEFVDLFDLKLPEDKVRHAQSEVI